MAKPLEPAWRETPILYGEDARRFLKRMKNPPKLSAEKKEKFEEMCKMFEATFVPS